MKPKFALYWAASCGGCEISVLEIHEKVLDLMEAVDIVFWPCAMDAKYKDVEAMPDKSIDVCLFNGAIRTTENEAMARLLRRKAKVLVAYGSCAHEGCIPGLANFKTKEDILKRAYETTETTENPEQVRPQVKVEVPEGELTLPGFRDYVSTLDQVVPVDYYIPGCPPTGEQTWAVLEAIVSGAPLPPAGSVLGATEKTVCDDCPRTRTEKKVRKFYRPYEIVADTQQCLMEQGIICAGMATRGGCGAKCPAVNMPCRGCYGPPPGIHDQGAKLLTAVASVVDSTDPDEIERIVDEIPDPQGTFYRFSLPASYFRPGGNS